MDIFSKGHLAPLNYRETVQSLTMAMDELGFSPADAAHDDAGGSWDEEDGIEERERKGKDQEAGGVVMISHSKSVRSSFCRRSIHQFLGSPISLESTLR